ncbi:hypothetical protein PFISCL1PPCAC_21952, partial [Pristionchus fissidentatus]
NSTITIAAVSGSIQSTTSNGNVETRRAPTIRISTQDHHPFCPNSGESLRKSETRSSSRAIGKALGDEALKAIDAIEYITEHLRNDNESKRQRDDWKYVALVIDRVLLYTFFAVTSCGTAGIIFSAPHVFEYVNQTEIIENIK